MDIAISRQQGSVPVIVMRPHGILDSSTYTSLIQKAQEAFNEGSRDLLLDLRDVPYMSSAGIMALHTIALMFGGTGLGYGGPPRSPGRQDDMNIGKHVKLLGVQDRVGQLLEVAGLVQFFHVFDDLEGAVRSFGE